MTRISSSSRPSCLRMIEYNMMSARGNRLEMVMREMCSMHVDIGILTETKLNHDMHTTECNGYCIVCTKAESAHLGGVALFYRSSCSTSSFSWSVEGIRTHGPNVISCTIVSGSHRWTLIGCYIPPSEDCSLGDDATLLHLQKAVATRALHPIIFLGDINVDLCHIDDDRAENIATFLALLGLSDVSDHFSHPRGRWTWSQMRQGHYIRSVTDYILAEAVENFSRWAIRYPRYDSDHRAIVAELRLAPLAVHRRYLRSRRPLVHIPRPFTRVDQLFHNLFVLSRSAHQDLSQRSARHRSWISANTWQLIDQRASLRQQLLPSSVPWSAQDLVDRELRFKALGKDIQRSLCRDRRKRAELVSQQAQAHYTAGRFHEAYRTIRGWYRRYGSRPTKPTKPDMKDIEQTYTALYAKRPPIGDPLPILVSPFMVNDEIPSEDEIIQGLRHMRRGRQGGLSGMLVEDLIDWYENHPEAWNMVLDLTQTAFRGDEIPLAFGYAVLCLMPKNEHGKFRGISLLEVLYKLCTTIIHLRFQDAISFHDGIHGFRHRRGTNTAIFEAKLLMQLHVRLGRPLFQIFIDLTKAYDALDRDRTLAILEGYGVGPRLLHFIRTNWDRLCYIPKVDGYYGSCIPCDSGTPQGDVDSPTLFDIVVDCVLRYWYSLLPDETLALIFYADDGRLGGDNADSVQHGLDLLVSLFARVGLHLNTDKTKAMITLGRNPVHHLSLAAYKRKYDSTLPSARARALRKVACSLCGSPMTHQYLPVHLREIHGILSLDPVAALGKHSCDHDLPPRDAKIARLACAGCPASETCDPQDVSLHIHDVHGATCLPDTVFRVSMPGYYTSASCPVPNCPASPPDRDRMYDHFMRMHPDFILCIEQDGIRPRCPNCRRHLCVVTPQHLLSQTCRRATARRQAAQLFSQAQASTANTHFHIGDSLIEIVAWFLYLGRILHKDDLDDLAITARLTKARTTWGSMSHILSTEGASCRIMARFYLAIIQATLLHGCESWVLTKRQMLRLEHFHLRCARHIARMNIHCQANGTWVTPHSDDVLERCGLSRLLDYIAKRKTTLLHHYAFEHSSLYRRCYTSVPTSDRHHLVWWDDAECRVMGVPPLMHSNGNGPSSRKRVRDPSDSGNDTRR